MCSNDQTNLWQKINEEFRNFKYDLCSTRPIFEIGLKTVPQVTLGGINNEKARFDILQEFLQPTTKEIEPFSEIDSKELHTVTENDVIGDIDKARGRLLPGFVPYSAAIKFIKEHQKKWKSPAQECLYKINDIMAELVDKSTDNTFLRFPALIGRMKYVLIIYLDTFFLILYI